MSVLQQSHNKNLLRKRFLALLLLATLALLNAQIDRVFASDVNPSRFEADIRAFENADEKRIVSDGGTVFVGSSTFTLWKGLEKDFSSFKAINRGFGGSTLPEINNYVPRIVTKYRPSKVVLYAGTNDIAELKHSGESVCSDFKQFVKLVREKLPACDIYFISMSMGPSRVEFPKEFASGNECIQSFVKGQTRLHYINVLPVMRNKDQSLKTELFGLDRLHMNERGYALWKPIVTHALKGD